MFQNGFIKDEAFHIISARREFDTQHIAPAAGYANRWCGCPAQHNERKIIMEIKVFHADENADGINDHISIRNMDFGNEPLIGDYRGIELCRINYIPSRPDSVARAEQIANIIAAQLRVQLTESGRASSLVELVAAFGN